MNTTTSKPGLAEHAVIVHISNSTDPNIGLDVIEDPLIDAIEAAGVGEFVDRLKHVSLRSTSASTDLPISRPALCIRIGRRGPLTAGTAVEARGVHRCP